MILLLSLIASVGTFVWSLVLHDPHQGRYGPGWAGWHIGMCIVSATIAVVMLIWILVHWWQSLDNNTHIISLRLNIPIIEQTAKDINAQSLVHNTAPGSSVRGVENLGQSKEASAAWCILRDAKRDLNWYISDRKVWLSNPLTSWVTAPLPRD